MRDWGLCCEHTGVAVLLDIVSKVELENVRRLVVKAKIDDVLRLLIFMLQTEVQIE